MRVLKFGGTSLANSERFLNVSDIVVKTHRKSQVALVLSAPAKVTNFLVELVAEAVKGKSEAEVQALIDEDIEKVNNDMPKYKRIKQVYLRTEPFEKTTTQKIKRRTVK